MKDIERTRIALPGGELQTNVNKLLKAVGLDFTDCGKQYLVPVKNMPLDLIVMRASDIPRILKDTRSNLKAGITGSDILWEAGLNANAGEALPIYELFPDITRPALFIGVTKRFEQETRIRNGSIGVIDLKNKMVVTKFPNISKETLNERGVKEITIFESPGKTEAIQYVFNDCVGIIDVVDSGRTIAANNIIELERFHQVATRLIESEEKMSQRDKQILDDIRDKITIAQQKRRLM